MGGLTVAHELSKRPNDFDITIVESNDYVGGQAARLMSDDVPYYAYWHVITSSYKYFLEIVNQITTPEGRNVISYLKPLNEYVYCMVNFNYVEYTNSFLSHSLKNFGNLYKILHKKNYQKRYFDYHVFVDLFQGNK